MSGILKIGSKVMFDDSNSGSKDCKDRYGPEWELDLKEYKILGIPYVLGRCVHKTYSGSDSYCCDNFLLKKNVFGTEGANSDSKTTCNQDANTITTCNKSNRKEECLKKMVSCDTLASSASNPNLCTLFVTSPGNNFEFLIKDVMDLFIKDYDGKYNK